jgi:hypothetical protein
MKVTSVLERAVRRRVRCSTKAMYTIESKVGRLIEVRFWAPILGEEPGAWRRDHERMIAAMLNTYVFFIDLGDAPVFPPDMIESLSVTMRNETRLLRMAMLLGSSPTLGLQMQRLVRDAQHPHRKIFREPREAEAYLSEILTLSERTRLHELAVDRKNDLSGPASTGPASVGVPSSVASSGLSGPPSSALGSPTSPRNVAPKSVRYTPSGPGSIRFGGGRPPSGNNNDS